MDVEVLEAGLDQGRSIRNKRAARARGYGEETDLAGADGRNRTGTCVEEEVHFPGKQRRHRRTDAAIRDMHGENVCLLLDELHGEVGAAAVAAGGVVQLAGIAA